MKDMKEKFKKFCGHLKTDATETLETNPLQKIRIDYQENKIDFYDFINAMHSYNKLIYQFANFLPYTGIEKIEIIEGNVVYTCKEQSIKLVFNGKDRRGIPFEMMNWGFYERNEMELFDRLIEDKMVIFDVGANIGWYTLVWGKKFQHVKIHSFEPILETYNYLVANVVINGLKNVHMHNFGLAEHNEDCHFAFYSEAACLASIQNVLDYKGAKKEKCTLRRLDSFCQDFNFRRVDLIKCDVEGAEFSFLLGAKETIKNFQPIITLELFHEWSNVFGYHPDEAIDFLRIQNYRVFLPNSSCLEEIRSYIPNDFDRQNYFFLHAKKHKRLIAKLLK